MTHYWRKAAIALLALQLAGCSAAGGEQSAEGDGTPAATNATASPAPHTSVTAHTVAPSPSSSSTATPDTAVTSQPEETRKLYRMNDAYRFVPLEEGVPDKAVLLTFDDGPKDEEVLTGMLDTLDKHKAKAIFFVNGYRVKQNPELLLTIHKRGQTIGNHSYDHINLKNEDSETVERQLGDVQAEVERLTGEKPRFFRPPYGSGNDTVKATAKNHGMLYMTWSNGSLDWESSAKDKPEVVIANVLEQLHPGANILMHELPWTADALDELLTELEKRGYGFIDPATIRLDID